MTALYMQAKANRQDYITPFDSDSYQIGIDNRYSACISDRIEDFGGPWRYPHHASDERYH